MHKIVKSSIPLCAKTVGVANDGMKGGGCLYMCVWGWFGGVGGGYDN